MTRETKTADELRQMVQERMDERTKIDNDSVVAAEVYWHAPDETGCNWSIRSFDGDHSWVPAFNGILRTVRDKFNLTAD